MPVRPSDLNARFSRQSLSGQFLLCRSESLIPEGWQRDQITDWILGSHPKLTVAKFGSEDAGFHGWLLGYAVQPLERRFVFGPDTRATVPVLSGFDDLEKWVENLTGQFVIIAFSSLQGRLYLDAAGGRSVVWCGHQEICASSAALIPYDDLTSDDDALIDALRIPETGHYFPFGLTPRQNIHRLLPNHYLDLAAWRTVRHWPSGPLPVVAPRDAIDEIFKSLSGVIEAVCEHEEPMMSLTAGRDSRMLLACAYNFSRQIQFFTWELPDATARADLQVAKILTKKYGLRHKVYRFREATREDKVEWLYRTGCAVGEPRGMSLVTTNKQMTHRFYLPGLGSEVGRAFYWKTTDQADTVLSPEELLARLHRHHPVLPPIVDCAASWLDGVPASNIFEVLDFLYIEQRLGCWAGVTDLGDADGPLRLPPFHNRRIFTLLLGLPQDYRINQQFSTDLIQRSQWQGLQDIAPFNPEARDLKSRLGRFIRKLPLLWRLAT